MFRNKGLENLKMKVGGKLYYININRYELK